jgi:hypothetical protein
VAPPSSPEHVGAGGFIDRDRNAGQRRHHHDRGGPLVPQLKQVVASLTVAGRSGE